MVAPGGHGVAGPEIQRLERAFLDRGSIGSLDLSEVEALELPPLVLPPPKDGVGDGVGDGDGSD